MPEVKLSITPIEGFPGNYKVEISGSGFENDDITYKRDLQKSIELINWVRENMNNPDIPICD